MHEVKLSTNRQKETRTKNPRHGKQFWEKMLSRRVTDAKKKRQPPILREPTSQTSEHAEIKIHMNPRPGSRSQLMHSKGERQVLNKAGKSHSSADRN